MCIVSLGFPRVNENKNLDYSILNNPHRNHFRHVESIRNKHLRQMVKLPHVEWAKIPVIKYAQ